MRHASDTTNWAALSDEELARRCADELDGCLDELVSRYEKRVKACAYRMSLERSDAEDAAQEILLRLIVSVPQYRGDSAFATWMFRLAHNTCVDAFRKQSRQRHRRWTIPAGREPNDVLDELMTPALSPERDFDAAIKECLVARATASLPERYRKVVILRLGQGRTNAEIAAELGRSVDSVKAMVRRARQLMRQQLRTPSTCPICSPMGPLRISPSGTLE